MSEEKKENLVGKISDKETENVSGGEIQEYRDLLYRRRYKLINDKTGNVARSGISDFDEALEYDEKLNKKPSVQINVKK